MPIIIFSINRYSKYKYGLLGWPSGNESACNAGDLGSIPGLGRSPREGNGNPLQYSCLENPMDGGAWRVTVYRVAKSWTWLSDLTSLLLQPIVINRQINLSGFLFLRILWRSWIRISLSSFHFSSSMLGFFSNSFLNQILIKFNIRSIVSFSNLFFKIKCISD